jgi:divalent metal cation (Fe/Co/Zn/Cd) transporter
MAFSTLGFMTDENHPKPFALRLSYFTVGYNVLEGLVSIVFAYLARSPALLGFGIDSFVESLSGMIMVWRFARTNDSAADERRERIAVRLVGVSLVVLAAYVAYEAATALYFDEPPQRTPAGLVIAVVSLVVMPVLYWVKRRTAAAVGSRSLAADAKQTFACMLLSVALLMGTGLHYTIGWWQADPVAALLIAAYLVRGGYEAWTEQELCCD